MDMDDIVVLQKRLQELKIQGRSDSKLGIEGFSRLFQAIQALENSIENYSESLNQPKAHVDLGSVERARRKLAVIEAIEGVRNPSYFDEFAATLTEHPYALPKALFDPQGKEVVTIDFPNNIGRQQFYKERTDLALFILYPGSFSYRYGVPTKIETGQWSQQFVAHLRMHTLSPNPIFKVQRNGRSLDVFKPIMLRAQQVTERNPFICVNCLSLAALDEGCSHSPQIRRPLRLPSSSPITVNQEVERSEGESIGLRSPLNFMITGITYLSSLKVGTAILGFERSAANRVTIVDYDPPIGMIMETKGVSFRINVPTVFLDRVTEQKALARDVLTQTLAKWISDLLSENGMPSYHLEPILSGLIHAIGLDEPTVETGLAIGNFSKGDWIADAEQTTMTEGSRYYERFDVQQRRLRAVYESLAKKPLDGSVLRNEVKQRLMHSFAHILLIAGCITSGCLPQDLAYLIRNDEVVLFDSADGGNGSSEMIFDFSGAKESFSITESEEDASKERIYRPRYFDEALAELLLPCQQGVAERIFHGALPVPGHQEIRRRILALDKQKESYAEAIRYIAKIGVENCFRSSLGYHQALNLGLPMREAERLKEGLSICLHGCPDCLVLGNKCDEGGFLEKFHLSKVLLDEYFRFMTGEVTVDYLTKYPLVESLLSNRGVAILVGRETKNEDSKISEKLHERVAELDGRKVGKKFVKFAGFWVDCPIGSEEVCYSAVLVLI
jgi:hypothetical protein